MQQSLLVRLLAFTLLFLLVVMAAVGYVLDTAYQQRQLEDWKERMQIHSYNLLAMIEEQGTSIGLPQQLPDQRFNNASAGLYAVLEQPDEVLWQSISARGLQRFSHGWSEPGDWDYSRASNGEQEILIARFGFEWQLLSLGGELRTFNLVLASTGDRQAAASQAFRQQLWWTLAEIIIVLMLLQMLVLYLGLRPLRRMTAELNLLQQGQSDQLADNYPRELLPLTSSFNRVLAAEHGQRERYRNTVADVSHSLKTPLTVMQGMLPQLTLPAEQQREIEQQLQRMSDTVQYQLQRAMTGQRVSAAQRIAVEPVLQSVVSALKKVYIDKAIHWQLELDEDCFFYGDDHDLMEIIGNLADNACKYGHQQVRICLYRQRKFCCLRIEDDGPGVPQQQYQQILQRGVRLDRRTPGQGFGLALVKEIIDACQAELKISPSSLGGACFEVRWEGGQPDQHGR